MPAPNPRVHNVADAAGPDQWFKSLPIVTQYWLAATACVTCATNFGVFSPTQMMYSWHHIRTQFELWRVFTALTYAGGFSFPTVITVYMLVSMSKQYEAGGPFNTGAGGGTADYVFALMFATATILATYPIVNGYIHPLPPIFCRTLVYFVLYIWSRRHPTGQANIWGVPVPAVYLPFAYLALTVCMGNSFADLVHGMAVGHLYYFLVEVFPRVQGKDLLVTPQFLIDQLGVGEYRPTRLREPAVRDGNDARRARPPPPGGGGGGYNWGGGGQALGRG